MTPTRFDITFTYDQGFQETHAYAGFDGATARLLKIRGHARVLLTPHWICMTQPGFATVVTSFVFPVKPRVFDPIQELRGVIGVKITSINAPAEHTVTPESGETLVVSLGSTGISIEAMTKNGKRRDIEKRAFAAGDIVVVEQPLEASDTLVPSPPLPALAAPVVAQTVLLPAPVPAAERAPCHCRRAIAGLAALIPR